jgi:hypothetical protein
VKGRLLCSSLAFGEQAAATGCARHSQLPCAAVPIWLDHSHLPCPVLETDKGTVPDGFAMLLAGAPATV